MVCCVVAGRYCSHACWYDSPTALQTNKQTAVDLLPAPLFLSAVFGWVSMFTLPPSGQEWNSMLHPNAGKLLHLTHPLDIRLSFHTHTHTHAGMNKHITPPNVGKLFHLTHPLDIRLSFHTHTHTHAGMNTHMHTLTFSLSHTHTHTDIRTRTHNHVRVRASERLCCAA